MSSPAGTYPNNLRLCRESLPGEPSLRSVARAAGMSFTTLGSLERGEIELRQKWVIKLLPVLKCTEEDMYAPGVLPKGFAEEATPYTAGPGSPLERIDLGGDEFLYTLIGNHLDDLGLKDGSIITVKIGAGVLDGMKTGDVVMAQVYGGPKGASTVVRQFVEPDLLITNSRRNNLPSLNRSAADVVVKGLVIASHWAHRR